MNEVKTCYVGYGLCWHESNLFTFFFKQGLYEMTWHVNLTGWSIVFSIFDVKVISNINTTSNVTVTKH